MADGPSAEVEKDVWTAGQQGEESFRRSHSDHPLASIGGQSREYFCADTKGRTLEVRRFVRFRKRKRQLSESLAGHAVGWRLGPGSVSEPLTVTSPTWSRVTVSSST